MKPERTKMVLALEDKSGGGARAVVESGVESLNFGFGVRVGRGCTKYGFLINFESSHTYFD
jgi:hypothetical protein